MGLDSVELAMGYEEEFDISISNADAEKFITPRLVGDLVERLLAEKGQIVPRELIDQKIKEITIDCLGLSETDYWLDGQFVRDFGID